jgi:hypothetical protein
MATTSGAESGCPLSSTERTPTFGDITDPTTNEHQWNGDPIKDWESWPTGRPGPFVSQSRMREVMYGFNYHDRQRNEQSRTKENIMHIAEFSLSGQGESDLYRTSTE